MAKESFRYHIPALQTFAQTFDAGLRQAHTESPPLISMKDRANVGLSMLTYLSNVDTQLQGRWQQLYDGLEIEGFRFKYLPRLGTKSMPVDTISNKHREMFYSDGEHSIVMGYQTASNDVPTWLGMVGVLAGTQLREDYAIDVKNVDDAPVIVQLQGPLQDAYTAEKGKEMRAYQEKVRWERLLMDLVVDWACDMQFKHMYVLPAELNKWKSGSPEQEARYTQRYDWTAKRLGFKEHKSGLLQRHLR